MPTKQMDEESASAVHASDNTTAESSLDDSNTQGGKEGKDDSVDADMEQQTTVFVRRLDPTVQESVSKPTAIPR